MNKIRAVPTPTDMTDMPEGPAAVPPGGPTEAEEPGYSAAISSEPGGTRVSQALCQFCENLSCCSCFNCEVNMCHKHAVRRFRFGLYLRAPLCPRCAENHWDMPDSGDDWSSQSRTHPTSAAASEIPGDAED